MADVTTKINGQDVTLRDVTDPAYTAPATGYVIHLTDAAARNFIRLGELADLRQERDRQVLERNRLNEEITLENEVRTEKIDRRNSLNDEIIQNNAIIQELVAWLQDQGDTA